MYHKLMPNSKRKTTFSLIDYFDDSPIMLSNLTILREIIHTRVYSSVTQSKINFVLDLNSGNWDGSKVVSIGNFDKLFHFIVFAFIDITIKATSKKEEGF